jgi:hypothetical protein
VYWRLMPILASADPRLVIHERGAKKESQIHTGAVFGVIWEVILTYESAPGSTPCPDHTSNDCGQPVLGVWP